jgi:hypothetical protein
VLASALTARPGRLRCRVALAGTQAPPPAVNHLKDPIVKAVTDIKCADFGSYFCTNPECVLHVRAGEPGVEGFGNWAVLPSGVQVGRRRYEGTYLCDRCGKAHRAAASAPSPAGSDGERAGSLEPESVSLPLAD